VTIAEALERAAEVLRGAGVPAPELDAERLLRHLLGWDRAKVLAERGASLEDAAALRLEALVRERAQRRPLQHLLGTQAFWRHEFLVGPEVLIPRPETELLVEEALRFLAGRERPVVVDVGTGSGCIALSLAAEREDVEVHAADASPEALEVARRNAERLALADRVSFHEGDLLDPLAALRGRVDLVLSNPPYVDPGSRPGLAPEVRDHEPALALFPQGDVYSFYRRLSAAAPRLLREGGGLVVEIGLGMEAEVVRILEEAGLTVTAVLPDLQGIPRAVLAVMRAPVSA
jgi:release factor glutamine methyltransferase